MNDDGELIEHPDFREWERRYMRGGIPRVEQQAKLVVDFLATGDLTATAAKHRIPIGTMRNFRKQQWWVDMMEMYIAEHREKLAVIQKRVLDKAYAQLEDRLENGDVVLDKGIPRRVPVPAYHLHKIAEGNVKMALGEKEKPNDGKAAMTLEALADKLMEITDKARTVEAQTVPFKMEEPPQ